MFGHMPSSPPKPEPGFFGFIKSFYSDSFKWDVVKSWSMFAFGVWISKEVCSIDLSAPPTVP